MPCPKSNGRVVADLTRETAKIDTNRNEPLMSIGQAVQVLQREFPDVTVSSLRFLEREGLISPTRRSGGHRLFSQDDLLRVRRIKQLQADRISLKEIRKRLEQSLSIADLEKVVEETTRHLLDGSIASAMIVLERVVEAETPLLTVFDEVLTPVMRNLGDDKGNHLIPVDMQFELDEELIGFIARATVLPAQVTGKPVILAACPPWERHDMPLRMLVALLLERGASVHFIGAQVDSEFATDANRRLNPDAILVSLTVPPSAVARQWFDDLIESMSGEQKLYIGGESSHELEYLASGNVIITGMPGYADILQQLRSDLDWG